MLIVIKEPLEHPVGLKFKKNNKKINPLDIMKQISWLLIYSNNNLNLILQIMISNSYRHNIISSITKYEKIQKRNSTYITEISEANRKYCFFKLYINYKLVNYLNIPNYTVN